MIVFGRSAILGLALTLAVTVRAQDLSTEVYTSEDELTEALADAFPEEEDEE